MSEVVKKGLWWRKNDENRYKAVTRRLYSLMDSESDTQFTLIMENGLGRLTETGWQQEKKMRWVVIEVNFHVECGRQVFDMHLLRRIYHNRRLQDIRKDLLSEYPMWVCEIRTRIEAAMAILDVDATAIIERENIGRTI